MDYTGKKVVSSKQWENWISGGRLITQTNLDEEPQIIQTSNLSTLVKATFCLQEFQEPCQVWRQASNYKQICSHSENIGSNSV